jgi:hypothetical protein
MQIALQVLHDFWMMCVAVGVRTHFPKQSARTKIYPDSNKQCAYRVIVMCEWSEYFSQN